MESSFKEKMDFLFELFSNEVLPDQFNQEEFIAEEMKRVLPDDAIWMFSIF